MAKKTKKQTEFTATQYAEKLGLTRMGMNLRIRDHISGRKSMGRGISVKKIGKYYLIIDNSLNNAKRK